MKTIYQMIGNWNELSSLSSRALEELHALAQRASSKEVRPGTQQTLEDFFQRGGVLALACANEMIVGAGYLFPIPTWNGSCVVYLTNLAVLEEAENRGIGTGLGQMLIDNAYEQFRAKAIVLTSAPDNDAANHLYEKLGFRLIQNFWRLNL